MASSQLEKVGKFWSEKASASHEGGQTKTRWWQFPQIIRHINKTVCGNEIDGVSQGLVQLARQKFPGKFPLMRGISVGCGEGAKEIALIRQGFVESFDLFELSEKRIEGGLSLASRNGVEAKVNFVKADAFKAVNVTEHYDLVYWNNSLHHMFDVHEAVKWSKRVLRTGGLFLMDDFIGAQRFQWSDWSLEIASKVRSSLPERYLRNPRDPARSIPARVGRPRWENMIAADPSEAADSHRIVEAVKESFPEALIIPTGGTIYHLALNDVLGNIDEEEDARLLELLLVADELCTSHGESHYAVALASKGV